MVNRRAFVTCLILSPLGRALAARKPYRIGILIPVESSDRVSGANPANSAVRAFLSGMHELGYVYGEHFVTDARGAEGRADLYPGLVSELVRVPVDVIVAAGPVLGAIKAATRTMPIVMAAGADPVKDGLAQSLAHPGGNFTGMSIQLAETTGKRLQLLRDLAPSAGTVVVLWESYFENVAIEANEAARSLGWKLEFVAAKDAAGLEAAFRSPEMVRAGALMVIPSGFMDRNARRIIEFAQQRRLPAMYALQRYVTEYGGLAYYGPDFNEIWHDAATYVDRLLKGALPGDLPIEQRKTLELTFNSNAGKAIGIGVPDSWRARGVKIIG